jgi:polar amino acid transport system substrate-binding protein
MHSVMKDPAQGVRRWLGWMIACAVGFFALAVTSTAAAGDALDQVRQNGTLVWGADQEGGGPYVFPREDDPNQVTGFEVELAAGLAKALGVEAQFSQGNWDKLRSLVQAGKVQIAINGYEWTSERASLMEASLPYYVYGLQLLVRKDATTLTSWEDLGKSDASGAKRKAGVLTGSAAETYLRDKLGGVIDVIGYDGNTDAMREVETGKLDATLQDTPIASFYASRFPGLKPIGEAVGKGHYVVYAKKGERRLIDAINGGIAGMLKSGELERIYRRYGIWNADQAELNLMAAAGTFPSALEPEVTLGARKHGLAVVRDYGPVMLEAAGMTVLLAVLSFPCAIVLGLFIAVGRRYGPRWLNVVLGAYVEFLRGTPVMLQLYFIFFFLPEVGIRVPALATSIIGLAINYSAYESEIYRAGLQAVPPGQMEAALSLGMSRGLAVRRIIVPQALRLVIPPVVNDFIALFKDTSVCSVVTIVELTKRYSVLSQNTQATVELMVMTGVLYMAMSYPLAIVSRQLERRLGAGAKP